MEFVEYKMLYSEALNVMKNITYKPSKVCNGGGIHLIEVKQKEQWIMRIGFYDDDSDGVVISVKAVYEKIIPYYFIHTMTPYGLLMIVRDLIHQYELHEADEFIKYKGKKVFDPHRTEIL